MKNIKLIVLAVTAMLFLGIGNVNAQENNPQTVIIQVFPDLDGAKLIPLLLVISPDGNSYEVSMNEVSVKTKKTATIDNLKNSSKKKSTNGKMRVFVIDGKSETSGYINIIMSKY